MIPFHCEIFLELYVSPLTYNTLWLQVLKDSTNLCFCDVNLSVKVFW